MPVKPMNRSLLRPFLAGAGLVFVAASNGCSCNRAADNDGGEAPGYHETEWAIVVDIGDGPDRTQVKLAPVPELNSGFAQAAADPSLHQKATIDTLDGAVSTPTDPNAATPGGTAAWALVYGAAIECGMGGRAPGTPASPVTTQFPIVPPWRTELGTESYYLFQVEPNSCSQVLAYEETLVCIADKLAEISDAVAPIRWEKVASAPKYDGLPAGAWTIRPQAEKDRFIARDLALNVLAHVPRTDSIILGSGDDSGSCSRLLARAASDASFAATHADMVFGSGSYPPPSLSDHKATAEARLAFEAHVLRAAGRLMQDLIRRSVFADLAGAEQRAARALDPLRGNQIAWGLADNYNGPYNSYAHAIRVLTGRWEIGPYSSDPECGGIGGLKLLEQAYGDDRNARDSDTPILTSGQKYAADLVQKSGIVLPATKLAADDSASVIREALRMQLLGDVARSRGFAPTAHGKIGDQKDAIELMVARAKEGDLHFAMERALHAYRLLTNSGESSTVPANVAGLKPAPYAASAVTAAGGAVIAGGVSTGALPSSAMARAGGLIEATQCNEKFGIVSSLSTDNWLGAYPGVATSERAQRWAMQDAFNVGHALLRRLVALREEAVAIAKLPKEGGVDRLARSAMAEVRAWAGAGRVYAQAEMPESGAAPSNMQVWLLGAHPEDFGTKAVDEVPAQLSLVYGPPWVAECAARLRDECPADFVAKYVRRPATNTILTPPFEEPTTEFPWRRWSGTTGSIVTLEFDLSTGATTNFAPQVVGKETKNEHLYLIADRDPKDPGARGMVLGTIALRRPIPGPGEDGTLATGFVISPMQRELLDAVIGGGGSSGSPALGDTTPAQPPSYCIDGVPRDLFVPLENELTSDGDQFESSWKHYLALAEQAAARADDLGQKMIDVGLQQEFRREAAGEQLADICGEPAALQKMTFTADGKPGAPKGEENLDQCFGEDRWDVTFLGTDNVPAKGEARRKELQRVLECSGAGAPNPLCKRLASGADPTTVSTVGLGIATTPKVETTNACANIRAVAHSLRASGLNDTVAQVAILEPWADHDRLAAVTAGLSMRVDPDGEWRVTYSGEVIMSSVDQDELWPGCMYSAPPAPGKLRKCLENPMARAFNAAFRRCDDLANRESVSMGSCETALGGADAKTSELQTLRIRVANALWTLGGVAGRVHPGMFSIQVPAVNFSVTDADWGESGRSTEEILTYYAPARFISADGALFKLDGGAEDANLLGTVRKVDPAFSAMTAASAYELPASHRAIYTTPKRYLHAEHSNDDIPFEFYHLNSFLKARTGRDRAAREWIEQQSLIDMFAGMSGLQCGDLLGAGSGSTWSADDITNAVASIKTNTIVRQSATGPVIEFPFVAYGHDLLYARSSLWGGSEACDYERIYDGGFHYGYYDRKIPGLLYSDEAPPVPSAFHTRPSGVLSVRKSGSTCTGTNLEHRSVIPGTTFPTARDLPPTMRVRAFAGSTPPADVCSASHQLVQALTIGCLAGDNRSASPTKAIEVKTEKDIPALRRWVASLAQDMRERLGKLHVEGLPKRVVSEIRGEGLGASAKKGTKGDKLQEATLAIGSLETAWMDVAENLDQIGIAVEKTQLAIEANTLVLEEKLVNLSVARANAIARIVVATAEALGTKAGINPLKGGAAAVKAIAQIGAAVYELQANSELESIAGKQKDNAVAQALVALRSEVLSRSTQIQKSMESIRGATTQLATVSGQLDRIENKARNEAAKASGADYYQTGGGEIVPLPVNTVLRRQYAIHEIRYRKALADAKYLAFLARRAIEQRIGVPLHDIGTRVGALDAPAVWADDVCRLQGLDYKKLKSNVGPDAGPDTGFIAELADQYIGDYVFKLKTFVDYYNVQYPSHEGDDTAILSLKSDLLSPPDVCLADASNLLHHSGRLTALTAATEEPPGDGRWQMHACDASRGRCLELLPGAALESPKEPPSGVLRGGVSWLRDVVPSSGEPDASLPTPGLLGGPSGMVSQRVHLEPGSYVLSWWDQARTTEGKTTDVTPVPYRAAVFDGTFGPIMGATPSPHMATSAAPWSPRRELAIEIQKAGDYFVSFAASAPASPFGSVAIANVQLERASAGGGATAYIATDATRKVVLNNCPTTNADDLRSAFERRCATTGSCYYELTTPFLVDTGLVKTPTAAVASKLAKGNFNYRHISIALNLVGTGVRSCDATPTSDCFGSGFVEYTLQHDANPAGVLDWNGDVRFFKFGLADVEHAKALAAERYITMPIGSADSSLLAQPGIEKTELRGRPLDGVYRLRIWDSPALQWHRLDDVQLVIKYRYWSRIERDGKTE